MIFTQSQILDMLDIMKRYELIFIAQQLGLQFLSQNDVAILLSAGIDVNQFKNNRGVIEDAFLFGLLAQAIGDDRAKKMNYKQFKKFVSSKNFVPLNEEEEYALQQVKSRAYTDITNLGARMRTSLSNSVLRNNQQQALVVQQIIKKKTIDAIKMRKGARGLAADLAETSKDWEVDWLRISYFLTHEAYNTGRAQSILHEYGQDAEVWFDVYKGACDSCRELYLTDPDDEDSEPIVFKLKDIIANGNNIGRKKANWLPTISPVHPYCFNSLKTKIYTSRGWKNISDIKIGDLVLTHRNRFRKVTNVIVHDYDGEDLYNINYLNSDNSKFEVKYITGNHPIFTLRGWIPVRDLTLNDTIFNSSLICSNCGKKINIQKNSTHLLKKELCLNCLRKFSAENQWKDYDFLNNGKIVYNELKRIFNNHSGKYKINKAKIVSIEKVEKNKRCNKLYNISVDEDESYIADGIIVHNCRCSVNYKRPGYTWDANLHSFNKPTKIKPTNKKLQNIDSLIKITK